MQHDDHGGSLQSHIRVFVLIFYSRYCQSGCMLVQDREGVLLVATGRRNIFVECNNCNIYWRGGEEMRLEWWSNSHVLQDP